MEGPADKRERRKKETGRGGGVSKAATAVAKEIGFSSLNERDFCCLGKAYYVPAFPLESPKQTHKANA